MTGKAKGMKRSGFQRSLGQEEFWRAVTKEGTVFCWFMALAADDPNHVVSCSGPLDAHHLIPKEWIKRHYASRKWEAPWPENRETWDREAALKDERNGVPVCRFHHSQLENHRIYLARDELPEAVFTFAADYGLESLLDRAYPERETDAA